MPTCSSCGVENPAGFRFCGNCGAPLAQAAPERRKTATLLFCDVIGSTALGERLDPEATRELMLRYFDEMRAVIERHSGTVEKFVGDAVMAVFGVPVAHEDDALRAVRAAAEMRHRLEALNDDLDRRFGSRIGLRIGVNTGEVVAGDATAREAFVSGDAVNVAARLEQAAEPGEILLGERTYRLVREAVRADPVPPLALKGKGQAVPAYRLAEVAAIRPRRRISVPLVGRREELATLERELEAAAAAGRARLVTLVGQPGVGKSRLAAEFLGSVDGAARVLEARCVSYGEGITYWPLAELVRQAGGIRDEDAAEEARAKVAALLAGAKDGDVAAGLLGQAIGLAEGGGATGEIAWAARKLFESLARERSLVLVLDDLHWAERALLDLVEQSAALARAPVLVLCLARPDLLDLRPNWPGTIVRIDPLAEADTSVLVERLAGDADLDEVVRERVLSASGGVPLFAEELLAILVEEGLLVQVAGQWRPRARLADFSIPPTIDALLAERLDRLEPHERRGLERGAVEGQLFHRGAVLALGDGPVDDALAQLVERELVRPAQPSFADEEAFAFRHSLMRDAAYGSLPKRERAELHERYARWLEGKTGDRITEYEEILAYHFEQAYRYRVDLRPLDDEARALALRAGRLLAAAGRRALGRTDVSAAAGLLGRMAELLPDDDEERIERLLDLGVALRDAGDFEGAARANAEAVERAAAQGLRPIEAQGRLAAAFLRLYTDPAGMDELVAAAETALPVFEELGDDTGLSQALWFLALSHWNGCRVAAAEELLSRALEHAERSGDRHWRDQIIGMLALSALTGPAPAEEALERCRTLAERVHGNLGVEALITAYAGPLAAMRGRFGVARQNAQRSNAILEDLGRRVPAAGARYYAATTELLAGDAPAAERIARSALETLESLGETVNSAALAALLAQALHRQGRTDEAVRMTEASERTAWPDDLFAQVGWRATRAEVLARGGEPERGETLAREALALLDGGDGLDLQGRALESLAETLAAQGRSDEAAAALREAVELYERKGNAVSAERARERLGAVG